MSRTRPAHPRVCGENRCLWARGRGVPGSSPRVRGKQAGLGADPDHDRLIPACAGKTRTAPMAPLMTPAHPRVCGENVRDAPSMATASGSSPRVRGKPTTTVSPWSSPRLIPACAGKTAPRWSRWRRWRAHPRVCGENGTSSPGYSARAGSSPRVRGKHGLARAMSVLRRLIPACAGKTRCGCGSTGCGGAHPRVCGENDNQSARKTRGLGSSPRVRGKRLKRAAWGGGWRLIPACAGKTRSSRRPARNCPAHPRVCGENSAAPGGFHCLRGSSPRVRGKRHIDTRVRVGGGLIPACAGKTSMLVQPRDERGAHPRVCGEN